MHGCLAQLVERRPYKANVGGSIPSAPTIALNHLKPRIANAYRAFTRSIRFQNLRESKINFP